MIFTSTDELKRRAERVCGALGSNATVRASESPIGEGHPTPDQVLASTWVVELDVPNPNAFEQRLRCADTPVVARIERDKIVVDMRTIADQEIEALIAALKT